MTISLAPLTTLGVTGFSPPLAAAYNRGMEILLPALGAAYASVLIWLIVRIVNRPKQWDKWKSFAVFLLVSPVIGVMCVVPIFPRLGNGRAVQAQPMQEQP